MKENNLYNLDWSKRFSYLKSVPFDSQDLSCNGTKFQIIKFEPGAVLEPHYHKSTCEIFYIRSGNGILKLNDKEFKCQPDSFFLCEPGDMHEFANNGTEDLVVLVFKTNEKEEDIFWK